MGQKTKKNKEKNLNQMAKSIQRPQKKLIVTDIWQGTKPKGSGLSDKIYLEVQPPKGRQVTQVNSGRKQSTALLTPYLPENVEQNNHTYHTQKI